MKFIFCLMNISTKEYIKSLNNNNNSNNNNNNNNNNK